VFRTGQKVGRGGLGLEYTPPGRRATSARLSLLLSDMAVFLRIAWVNLVAVAGAGAALAPLLRRRRPVGSRSAPAPRRAARVIPFTGARRAQTR
jgi:hypothetical protein